jgi:hypothetical protein
VTQHPVKLPYAKSGPPVIIQNGGQLARRGICSFQIFVPTCSYEQARRRRNLSLGGEVIYPRQQLMCKRIGIYPVLLHFLASDVLYELDGGAARSSHFPDRTAGGLATQFRGRDALAEPVHSLRLWAD